MHYFCHSDQLNYYQFLCIVTVTVTQNDALFMITQSAIVNVTVYN